MRRLAFWLALLIVASVVVFAVDSEQRSTVDACTQRSYTERAARVAARAGTLLHTAQTTGWQPPTIKENVDGGFKVITTVRDAFKSAAETGSADKVISDLAPPPVDCTSTLDPCTAGLGSAGNSPDKSIIQTAISVGKARGIPEQGLVVILAAGMQESGIRNLNYGDRDSVGWLQQRASWGSVQQRMDPAYAAGKFYDALVRVPGWQQMTVTQAAQAVQVSAYPNAYAQWEDKARQFVKGTVSNAEPAVPDCGSVDLSIATWNAWKGNSDKQAVAGVRRLVASGAGVIGLQEFKDRSRKRAVLAALPGWKMVEERYAIPILVSPAFTVINSDVEVAMRRHHVEPGADGVDVGPREAVTATLRDRSGIRFSVINTHPIPSAGPGNAFDPSKPKRVKAYIEHVEHVTTKIVPRLRKLGDVYATCDCNLTFDPFGMWAKAGMHSDASLGKVATKGRRQIDLVWSTAKPDSHESLGVSGSDHASKLVVFRKDPVVAAPAPAGSMNLPGNRTASEAVATMTGWATSGRHIAPDRCLHYVAAAYGHSTTAAINGRYWAKDVFAATPDEYRHPGDKNPPAGALVFWNIRDGHPGHIALSAGGGKIISTDVPSDGSVGVRPMTYFDGYSGYLGWTEPYFPERTRS